MPQPPLNRFHCNQAITYFGKGRAGKVWKTSHQSHNGAATVTVRKNGKRKYYGITKWVRSNVPVIFSRGNLSSPSLIREFSREGCSWSLSSSVSDGTVARTFSDHLVYDSSRHVHLPKVPIPTRGVGQNERKKGGWVRGGQQM